MHILIKHSYNLSQVAVPSDETSAKSSELIPFLWILKEEYNSIAEEIFHYRELKQKALTDGATRDDQVNRLKELSIPVQFEPAVRSLRATIPEAQSHRSCHQKHYSTVLLT